MKEFNELKSFKETAKELAARETNSNLANISKIQDYKVKPSDVYVVWYSKTLKNAKMLLGTNVSDRLYFEATLNGDKHEMYFDTYKKVHNQKVNM